MHSCGKKSKPSNTIQMNRQHHNLPQQYYETRMKRYLELLKRVSHTHTPTPSYEDPKAMLFPIIRRKRNPLIPAEPCPPAAPAFPSAPTRPVPPAPFTCLESSPSPVPAHPRAGLDAVRSQTQVKAQKRLNSDY